MKEFSFLKFSDCFTICDFFMHKINKIKYNRYLKHLSLPLSEAIKFCCDNFFSIQSPETQKLNVGYFYSQFNPIFSKALKFEIEMMKNNHYASTSSNLYSQLLIHLVVKVYLGNSYYFL